MIKRYKDLIKIASYLIIIPLILWNLTIGKSINIWSEYHDNMVQLENEKIDTISTRITKTNISPEGSLLDFVAMNNQIEIVKYNRYTTITKEDYSLMINVLEVTGDFFELLKIINKIEKLWDINSLLLNSEMDYKNKRKTLNATIITHDITKIK